jgi:hypothetical protein
MKMPGYGGNELMAMPLHLTVKHGTYLMGQKVNGRQEVPADHGA